MRTNTFSRDNDTGFLPGVRKMLAFYDLFWGIFFPLLHLNKRLRWGWDQRRLKTPLPRADLWLQAASAGEAYLVREILDTLAPSKPVRVLVTTNTSQGFDILDKIRTDVNPVRRNIRVAVRYFPFDRPRLMRAAVDAVRPRLVGLLETELWPGLLAALKAAKVPAITINGRLNRSSLKRYRLWPALWRALAPDRIMAISPEDAAKFGCLFDQTPITVMPNIKFDQWYRQLKSGPDNGRLDGLFGSGGRLAVFGSVRKEEENQVEAMVRRIVDQVPEAVIALFPRHMNRLVAWRKILNRNDFSWIFRSRLDGMVPPVRVVLWDTFGELRDAYQTATTAFVGGSLVPLGGQNFLEPLACGVIPVIGPSYFNFHWVGEEIFRMGLVRRTTNWKTAADQMIAALKNPVAPEDVRWQAKRYARERTGGTRQACRAIEKYFN